MIPLFQIFFGMVFKKVLILEYLGVFTKSIVVSILDFFWHISFLERCLIFWLVKKNHNSEFGHDVRRLEIVFGGRVLINLKLIHMAFGYDVRWFIIESPVGRHVLNVFYLKDFVTWQVCKMLSGISLSGIFTLLLATTTLGRHVNDFKVGSWLRIKFPVSWAPCSECKA
jgi:hypothetical protein